MSQEYFFSASTVQTGNQVTLLSSGEEIFSEILKLIELAQFRIVLQTYYFEADEIGKKVALALVEAKKRGVDVRLMVDSVGSFFTPEKFFQDLKSKGVEVQYYHAIRFFKSQWKLFKRNHRKILVVDAEKSIIGGFNIADDYWKSPAQGGFFDLAVRMDGPASSHAWELFDLSWQGLTDRRLFTKKDRRKKLRPQVGEHPVLVLGNDHFLDRWKIRRELLYCFYKAKTSIDIINPYFLPDPGVVSALIEAKKRGVRIRILLPSFTDVTLIDLASKVIQHKLLGQGIEIYKWNGFIHAKMVLVDQLLASIGSFNMDYRSVFHNLEVNVHILDPLFATKVLDVFEAQVIWSKPVNASDWAKTGFAAKVLSRLIYRLRAFL